MNCEVKNADMTLARLVSSQTFDSRPSAADTLLLKRFVTKCLGMMAALFNTSLISSAFTGLPPTENNVYIYDNEFPLIQYVGSGKLFVDSIQYSGRLTYSPDAENIADNGQFMVGGGHQGRSVDCEISRVRLWSRALSEEQLSALQGCDLDVERFLGGPWPHDLHASWAFNGNFSNLFGPLENLTEQSVWEEQTGTGFNSADQMNYP